MRRCSNRKQIRIIVSSTVDLKLVSYANQADKETRGKFMPAPSSENMSAMGETMLCERYLVARNILQLKCNEFRKCWPPVSINSNNSINNIKNYIQINVILKYQTKMMFNQVDAAHWWWMRRYTPYYVKRFECLEKHYINVTNYYYYYYLQNILYYLNI